MMPLAVAVGIAEIVVLLVLVVVVVALVTAMGYGTLRLLRRMERRRGT